MTMPRVLFFLIVSGVFIPRAVASKEQEHDQDVMMDEDIKEMTNENILSGNNNETNSSFVDDRSMDKELKDIPDPDTVWDIGIVIFVISSVVILLVPIGLAIAFCCMGCIYNRDRRGNREHI